MDLLDRITVDPEICHGKACIRGMRFPVESLLEMLAAGMTEAEILGDHDYLEPQDITAALAWAARLARVNVVTKFAA